MDLADRDEQANTILEGLNGDSRKWIWIRFLLEPFEYWNAGSPDDVRSLIVKSGKLSRRHHADLMSAAHVEQARDYLVTSSSRRWFRHVGAVGGILLGKL